jgi:lipoate-protein ligase A
MQKAFKNKAVAINELTTEKITLDQAKAAFKKGFEEGLNIELEPYKLTDEEMAYVQKIAKERYESDDWNYKR